MYVYQQHFCWDNGRFTYFGPKQGFPTITEWQARFGYEFDRMIQEPAGYYQNGCIGVGNGTACGKNAFHVIFRQIRVVWAPPPKAFVLKTYTPWIGIQKLANGFAKCYDGTWYWC
jgi:hypothetical protein